MPEKLRVEDYAKAWHDALLSGKYEQGSGMLKNENEEYCCLGVLCVVADSPFEGDEWYLDDDHWENYSPELKVPKHLQKSNMTEDDASSLNDNWELSFDQIAQCIRHTYPAQFEETER